MAKHRWTEAEMNRTIDLHLAYRTNRAGRDHALEALSRELKLRLGQVSIAVDAVGTLDPTAPRKLPPAQQ